MRWANVQAIDVEFSQELTHQKSLKSVNFDRVIQKIKRWTFGGHSVLLRVIFQISAAQSCCRLYCHIIIRPHRSTTHVDAACCYRQSSMVCLSVCLSVTVRFLWKIILADPSFLTSTQRHPLESGNKSGPTLLNPTQSNPGIEPTHVHL